PITSPPAAPREWIRPRRYAASSRCQLPVPRLRGCRFPALGGRSPNRPLGGGRPPGALGARSANRLLCGARPYGPARCRIANSAVTQRSDLTESAPLAPQNVGLHT